MQICAVAQHVGNWGQPPRSCFSLQLTHNASMAPIDLTSFEGATWGTEMGSLKPPPWPFINFEAVNWGLEGHGNA